MSKVNFSEYYLRIFPWKNCLERFLHNVLWYYLHVQKHWQDLHGILKEERKQYQQQWTRSYKENKDDELLIREYFYKIEKFLH